MFAKFHAAIAIVVLSAATAAFGQSSPPPSKTDTPAILEISGDKREALKLLRQGGYQAVELKDAHYTLPSVEIAAPDSVSYGDMVVVKAKLDRSKMPDNLIQVRYQWMVLYNGQPTSNFLPWPDGSLITFGSGIKDGTFTIMLDVDCLFGVEQTVKINNADAKVYTDVEINSPDLATKQIVVGSSPGPGPGPTPNPNPGPNPPSPPTPPAPPVLPAGRYGLAQFAYNAVVNDATLAAADKPRFASSLASGFGGVAANIAAVQNFPKDIPTLLVKTKEANAAAIAASGVNVASTTGVQKVLGDQVYSLIYGPTPTIVTAADLQTAWSELATGLSAVK